MSKKNRKADHGTYALSITVGFFAGLGLAPMLPLIHIPEPTRLLSTPHAVFCSTHKHRYSDPFSIDPSRPSSSFHNYLAFIVSMLYIVYLLLCLI